MLIWRRVGRLTSVHRSVLGMLGAQCALSEPAMEMVKADMMKQKTVRRVVGCGWVRLCGSSKQKQEL